MKRAVYNKLDKKHIVSITYKNETRTFRLHSKRAANTLVLLVENHPKGITTSDMKDVYGIDDNKLFGELLDQSGFREYLVSKTRRNRLKVWEILLDELFENTKIYESVIWFGVSNQNNISKFKKSLVERNGLRCNIIGLTLYEKSTGRFMSQLRKPAIDHRIPQMKRGEDKLENLQLLSYYVNERKNQICAKCNESSCLECALAFPETCNTIKSTKENIKDIIYHFQ